MILGCGFYPFPGKAIVQECCFPAIDVLSAALFHPLADERIDAYARVAGMPVLVSAFSWTGDAFTRVRTLCEPRGLTRVERMLRRGRLALKLAFVHRAVVGYSWACWTDGVGPKPPFADGLVHSDDSEADEHVELLADLNSRAEAIRSESK